MYDNYKQGLGANRLYLCYVGGRNYPPPEIPQRQCEMTNQKPGSDKEPTQKRTKN